MSSRSRTVRGVLAGALALGLGLVGPAPAPAQAAGELVTPVLASPIIDAPTSHSVTWVRFKYAGRQLKDNSSTSFAEGVTIAGRSAGSSCGMATTADDVTFCVEVDLGAATALPGQSTALTLNFDVAAVGLSDGTPVGAATRLAATVVRHGIPRYDGPAQVATLAGTPVLRDLGAWSTAGTLTYSLNSAPQGARLVGSTLEWDGVRGGSVSVSATDIFGRRLSYAVTLSALAPVVMQGGTVRVEASKTSRHMEAVPGATALTSYRVRSGVLPGFSVQAASGWLQLDGTAATVGSWSAVIEAYQTVDGVDIELGASTYVIEAVTGPTILASSHTVTGFVGRPVDATLELATGDSVSALVLPSGSGWDRWSGARQPSGAKAWTATVRGTPTVAGRESRALQVIGIVGYTDITVNLDIAPAPVPTAMVFPRETAGPVRADGGTILFDVEWRDAASAGSLVDMPELVDGGDIVVTGVVNPSVVVAQVSTGRWTLAVTGTGWTGTEVSVRIPAGAVENAWGVGNAAAAATRLVSVVEPLPLSLPPYRHDVQGGAIHMATGLELTPTQAIGSVTIEDGPAWLTYSAGYLVGVAAAPGSYDLTVVAVDTLGQESRATMTLVIDPPASPPAFVGAPPSSISVKVGEPVLATFATSGFPVPSLQLGPLPVVLPVGLTFTDHGDGTATLSGTPTEVGAWSGDVVALSPVDVVSHALRLEVVAASVAPTFVGAPPTSVAATVGTPVSVTFTASGTPVPVFSVAASSAFGALVPFAAPRAGTRGPVLALPGPVVHTAGLPAGVTLTDNQDGTATLAGTPTVAGEWSFDVVASNVSGRVAHAVKLVVAAVTPPTTVPPTEDPTTVPPTEDPTTVPPTVPPTETPTEDPTTVPPTETPTDGPTDDASDEPSTPAPSTTEPSDDDALPVTGTRPLVGLGLAVLLAAAGVVVLAMRRRTA